MADGAMASKLGLGSRTLKSTFQKAGRKVQAQNRVKQLFQSMTEIPEEQRRSFLAGFPKDLGIAKQEEGAPELQKWLGLIREWLGELLGVGEDLVAVRVKKLLESEGWTQVYNAGGLSDLQ